MNYVTPKAGAYAWAFVQQMASEGMTKFLNVTIDVLLKSDFYVQQNPVRFWGGFVDHQSRT